MRLIPTTLFFNYLKDLELEEDNHSIVVFVGNMITALLHWMPRGIPQYTDHGLLHSVNVLRHVRDIVRTYPTEFSENEKFLLALASLLHDIGCLAGREKHNEKTLRIIKKRQFDFLRYELDPVVLRSLETIILAHSSSFNLNTIGDDPVPEIRLKLMASFFRLADACDISAARVKKILFEILVEENLLKEEHVEYWNSHFAIENINISSTKINQWIYDKEVCKISLEHFAEEVVTINDVLIEKELPIFTIEEHIVEEHIIEE